MVAENNKKIYVLDTNVVVHDPNAYKTFEGVNIGIPAEVLEELDKFKHEGTDRGRNAREFVRQLDALRRQGSLREGVALEHGATIRVLFSDGQPHEMPFELDVKDNKILLTTLALRDEGYDVKFISKDINARIKADALGITAEDYIKEFVTEEEFYKGWITVPVPSIQLKNDQPQVFQELIEKNVLTVNQFILLQSQHNPHNYRVFRYMGGRDFQDVNAPQLHWPLQPRNPQQLMAMNLLLDDSVQLVTLLGPAGTGKTFLALLAGLDKVVHDEYKKMLISRPVVPLGRDIGYLPGTLEEKMHSWMLPIYDNMEFILHSVNVAQHEQEIEDFQRGGKGGGGNKKKNKFKKDRAGFGSVEDLVHRGMLSMEAITYMRGRSIPYQYILIDEAQNLTPHEVKTIVTRVGEGSKVILAGDPYQIDSLYLDFASNGLVSVSERFKGHRIFGSVFLETSERSELSKLAGKLL